MKIVFFGTPDYVIPILDCLHKAFKTKSGESPITAVVTQPPRPVGRKKVTTYSPVDTWAYKMKVSVHHKLVDLPEADVGILASYGKILPKKVLNHFPHGILNIHPSLLPKFRGASPVQTTIISGEQPGATIIKLDEQMDHGPIISQFKGGIKKDDTTETLRNRLFERSAEVLVTLLPAYIKGKITPQPQNHNKATYTTLVKKEDAFIPPKFLNACLRGQAFKADWKIPFLKTKSSQASLIINYTLNPTPYALNRFIRAMQPWPQAWTTVQLNSKLKRLKILKAHIEKRSNEVTKKLTNNLVLDEIQLEGKNPVSFKQFVEAYPGFKFSDN